MKHKNTIDFEFSSFVFFEILQQALAWTISCAENESDLIAQGESDDVRQRLLEFSKVSKLALDKIQKDLSSITFASLKDVHHIDEDGNFTIAINKGILVALPRAIGLIQQGIDETKSQLATARNSKLSVTAALLSVTLVDAKNHLEMFSRIQEQLVAEGRKAEK